MTATPITSTSWVCTVCGYVHDGPQPPEGCPICGATADLFEPEDASFQVSETEHDGHHFGFLFRDGHLAGAILLGDTRCAAALKAAIEEGRDASALLRGQPAATDVVAWLNEGCLPC